MRRLRFPLFPYSIRWLGVLGIAGVLVYFSLLTTVSAPPGQGPLWDKKLHLAGYAALGLSLIYATATSQENPTHRALLAVGAAVAFGVIIEILQAPLPARYFSTADMLANTLGALLASGWIVVETRIEYVDLTR